MRKKWYPRWMGAGFAILGCLMMVYGIYRGEADVVFQKAIRICLECIGIG